VISAAADLARRLAREAEAVCRHYLSKGNRSGRYWIVGDVQNTPGRSLYVRLSGPDYGPGAAGKWTDAATGEHGDLLDLIRLNRGLPDLHEAINEARRFLALPRDERRTQPEPAATNLPTASRTGRAARRLFRAGHPLQGTHAEAYLRARGITGHIDWVALRFHPRVWYRETNKAPLEAWPALLAAVTDPGGQITGIQRTWLDRRRPDKAPIADPRRALGHLLGNGVRFGDAEPGTAQAGVLVAGEGIETMLALKSVLPLLPMIAALSANHLAALDLSPRVKPGPGSAPRSDQRQVLRRLYVARDNDMAGITAAKRLRERGESIGIDVRDLVPVHGDFNTDLCRFGGAVMLGHLVLQLAPDDLLRFVSAEDLHRLA
jgi:hypothetical protein